MQGNYQESGGDAIAANPDNVKSMPASNAGGIDGVENQHAMQDNGHRTRRYGDAQETKIRIGRNR